MTIARSWGQYWKTTCLPRALRCLRIRLVRAVSVPPDSNLGVICIITIFWVLLFCFMMCSAVYLGRLDSTFVEDNTAPRSPSSHFPMSEEGILAKTLCHLRVAVEICDRRNPRFVVTGFHKESGLLMLQYLVQYWKIRAYYWLSSSHIFEELHW